MLHGVYGVEHVARCVRYRERELFAAFLFSKFVGRIVRIRAVPSKWKCHDKYLSAPE